MIETIERNATPAPQNITIPADATAVYAFAGSYGGANLTNLPVMTLAGASARAAAGSLTMPSWIQSTGTPSATAIPRTSAPTSRPTSA